MAHTLADLLDCLDLTRTGDTTFRGRCADLPLRRIFGGQVAAQALVAAGRTVEPDRLPHSLHAYFLRTGAPDRDVDFTVDVTRDGGSYSNRHVEARQGDSVIFQLIASFAREQDGPEHRPARPEVPAPDGPGGGTAPPRGMSTDPQDFGSLEMRAVPDGTEDTDDTARMYWRRASGPLPDDPLLHAAVLTFASDLGTVSAVVRPHRPSGHSEARRAWEGASLDHTIWFHRRLRADAWLLFTSASPTASGGRGLMLGEVFDADGVLVASIAQESVVRPRRTR